MIFLLSRIAFKFHLNTRADSDRMSEIVLEQLNKFFSDCFVSWKNKMDSELFNFLTRMTEDEQSQNLKMSTASRYFINLKNLKFVESRLMESKVMCLTTNSYYFSVYYVKTYK